MEVENGHLEDYFPLPTGGFPRNHVSESECIGRFDDVRSPQGVKWLKKQGLGDSRWKKREILSTCMLVEK